MKDISLSRRAVMLGVAALPLARKAAAQARPGSVVVSSANSFNGGINCCAKAMELIKGGSDTLDAVIAGVNILELDPRETSVGYGGLPNEDGVVELDASCIHGPSRSGGAVGALRQGLRLPGRRSDDRPLTPCLAHLEARNARPRRAHQLGVHYRCAAEEEDRRVAEGVPRRGRQYSGLGVPGGGEPSARHHQLHRVERKG